MQQGSDDGHIDPSHWLPPDSPVVTPERAAKGDLSLTRAADGRVTHAEPVDGTILGYLVDRGTLQDHHRYYGMVFLDLKRYFLRRTAHRANPIYALEFFSTSNSAVLERVYLLACRRLRRPREQLVLIACTTPVSRVSHAGLGYARERYQDAFEALVEAIDDARRQARDEEDRGAI